MVMGDGDGIVWECICGGVVVGYDGDGMIIGGVGDGGIYGGVEGIGFIWGDGCFGCVAYLVFYGDGGGGWLGYLGVGFRRMPSTLISVFRQGRSLEARNQAPNC